MRDIQHPNIVRLYDSFENSKYIFLVLELCRGGDLSTFIKRSKRLDENIAQSFLKQLSSGLYFLSESSIIHRDLKPANVLLSEPSEYAILKLADFGFAKYLAEASLAQTQCGSPLYMVKLNFVYIYTHCC
jgi:serine/threonine-protein kinase ULK/ATG1